MLVLATIEATSPGMSLKTLVLDLINPTGLAEAQVAGGQSTSWTAHQER